jgi:hypothetical protein
MKENIYKIIYNNGHSIIVKAMSMILKDGKLFQTCKCIPFDNPIPTILDVANIKSIECIERHNEIDMEV